jgi:ubiquinone/menaquinone biosynthesis C-methylase UbiE
MEQSMRDKHDETGAAWNVAAGVYEREEKEDIALLLSGRSKLLTPELHILQGLKPWCKSAIHLQCAGGSDTLSLWNMGASKVVGVDISQKMIEIARRKSKILNAPAHWYCCDVMDTPHELDASADLVYTGKGALPWMMDIQAWARVVERLLIPGGRLYVFEGHPLDWVWDMESSTYQFSSRTGNYFMETPITDRGWPIYADPIEEHAHKELLHVHEHQWTLGEILNSLVKVGLQLELFEEYSEVFWNQFPNIPGELLSRLPHTFSLLMRKL